VTGCPPAGCASEPSISSQHLADDVLPIILRKAFEIAGVSMRSRRLPTRSPAVVTSGSPCQNVFLVMATGANGEKLSALRIDDADGFPSLNARRSFDLHK